MNLPHSLTRSLLIHARRDTVFAFFVDSERFARWWGAGSTIDGRVGGEVRIVYPNRVVARGTITAFEPGRRIAFTYGYEGAHPELPPGTSLVTIELGDEGDGTRLSMRHDLPDQKLRDHHVPGWRYHLAVFANVASDEQHRDATTTIDRWFAAWAETDGARRVEALAACTTEGITMQDPWSCLAGRDDLSGHIANTHVHMPGIVMRREAAVRHCQGTVLADWKADDGSGKTLQRGTNVVRLAADGRIASVTGFPRQA